MPSIDPPHHAWYAYPHGHALVGPSQVGKPACGVAAASFSPFLFTQQKAPAGLIGGNKWRLIATVAYSIQIVWVKHILTHTEYDKGAWK